MEFVSLGKICKTRGLKGEVKIYSTTEFGKDRYKKGNKVYLFNKENNQRTEMIVHSFSTDGTFDFVSFENYLDINLITPFLNQEVEAEKTILPNGMYYHKDLIGLKVIDQNGSEFGTTLDVEEFTYQKSLRIKLINGKEFLLPFIEPFIKKVDLENKIIYVVLIKGMGE